MSRPADARWYTDKDAFEQELAKHGDYSSAARAHGLARSTLSTWGRRHGLSPRTPGTAPRSAHTAAEVSEEEILRQRLNEAERALQTGRARDVFDERIIRAIQSSLQSSKPKYSPLVIPKGGPTEKHEFVLLWSDTHASEIVTKEETNGINAYDWDIMLRRHGEVFNSVMSYLENRPWKVEKLHILALGDMLSGNIHQELAETNEFPLAEATVQFGLDASEWIESFVPHFKEVHVAGVVGNHPRAHPKPQAKKSFDNADWTMYQVMRQRLAQCKTVRFDIPKAAAWPVEVANRRILMFHGDGIRSTMPGVPWGGVLRRVGALQNQYADAGMPPDYYALGHFHETNIVRSKTVWMNGSMKGPDEYIIKQRGAGSPAQQLLLTLHPGKGLTDASWIDLREGA